MNNKFKVLLLVICCMLLFGSSVAAAETKKNTYTVTCGKKISINLNDLIKIDNDKLTIKIVKPNIASAKVSNKKLIINGKKVGSTKIVLNNGEKKCVVICYVSPKGFSLKAPMVNVASGIKVNGKHVHEVSWSKVKGATGYKIYRVYKSKSEIKKVLVKKITASNDTSVFIPTKDFSGAIYCVQAYKKFKGKVYYGVDGYNSEVME